jgi:hypothetical protein
MLLCHGPPTEPVEVLIGARGEVGSAFSILQDLPSLSKADLQVFMKDIRVIMSNLEHRWRYFVSQYAPEPSRLLRYLDRPVGYMNGQVVLAVDFAHKENTKRIETKVGWLHWALLALVAQVAALGATLALHNLPRRAVGVWLSAPVVTRAVAGQQPTTV